MLRLRLALANGARAEASALAQAGPLRDPPRAAAGPDDVAARVAHAQWLASVGDAGAASAFDAALVLARRVGSPLAIRDAAVPYARFRLARAEIDDARTLAALVAPCADRDFVCARGAFEMARADGDTLAADRYASAARRLAGERPFDPGEPAAGRAGPRRAVATRP